MKNLSVERKKAERIFETVRPFFSMHPLVVEFNDARHDDHRHGGLHGGHRDGHRHGDLRRDDHRDVHPTILHLDDSSTCNVRHFFCKTIASIYPVFAETNAV